MTAGHRVARPPSPRAVWTVFFAGLAASPSLSPSTAFTAPLPPSIAVAVAGAGAGTKNQSPPAPDTPALFEPALDDDVDALSLPAARRPEPRPTVVAATLTRARADTIFSVLLNPAALREALPALVRLDVVATRPGARREGWPDRLIEWELEIPLFNLSGRGWLVQRDDAVELNLIEGAFAPGRVRLRAAPAAARAGTTILVCALQIDARASNWIFRRVARHDPWSETAMTAATAWVLARALALRAETPPGATVARPTTPIRPPDARALDGATLGAPALAPLRAAGRLGVVRRAPDGRLAWASVAVPIPASPDARARTATPETWQVFPGWKSVKRVARAMPGIAPPAILFEVDDNVAFVDLDATWALAPGPTPRATAVKGDIRGAALAWDILAGDDPGTSLAVLSMHPHLDAAGYVERKLMTAEPLLEHGVAIAMTYADAAAVADSLLDQPAAPARERDTSSGVRTSPH